MGKSSGGTRASSPNAPKGLYQTINFIDEDSGESIEVRVPSFDREAYEREYSALESERRREEDNFREQLLDNGSKMTAAERELEGLQESRRVFESDMEDELGRLSGAQQDRRAAWYGTQLQRIDRQIARAETQIERFQKQEEKILDKESAFWARWERKVNQLEKKYRG